MHEISPLLKVTTISEAAILCSCGQNTIRYHMNSGEISYRKTDSSIILIDMDSLSRFYEKRYGSPIKELADICLVNAIK